MNDLSEITVNELCSIKGIGPAKAITVLAGIELGLRILKFAPEKIKLNTPQRVFNLLKDELKPLKQETLIALYLNVKGELIIKKTLFVGTVNLIVIDAKEIFKWAYKHSASAIILVHNHPSGDPTPSQHDLQMTKVLLQQADALGFVIIDHIVIGDRFFSMKQQTNLFNC
jgi:DNA repair protein RadC